MFWKHSFLIYILKSSDNWELHFNMYKRKSSDINKMESLIPSNNQSNNATVSPKSSEECIPTSSESDKPGINSSNDKIELKKSISLLSCSAIMIAATGHVSIFIAPSAILVTSGSIGASLIIWLIGGLINLTQALCYAELGTVFPKAGGPYAYVLNICGPLQGFVLLWGYLIFIIGAYWAFLAQTAALYIIKPAFANCNPPDIGVKLVAGWIILTVVVLNCVYMKYITKAQSALTSCKLFALLIIVIGGLVLLFEGKNEHFKEPFASTTHNPGDIAMSVFYSIFSFSGWHVVAGLVEEMKNPGRDLPRSIYLTFVVVMLKYTLTIVAYCVVLTLNEVAKSESVALDFIERLYQPLSPLIAVFVALSSIGALNASVMGHPRVFFAAAQVGHAPKLMGMLHEKFRVPWPSTFVLCIWSLLMLYKGSLLEFMQVVSLFSSYIAVHVTGALLYFRWKSPEVHRPYKVNILFPIFQVLFNSSLLVLGFYSDPRRLIIGAIFVCVMLPLYWIAVIWKNKPVGCNRFIDKITMTCQKIFSVRISS